MQPEEQSTSTESKPHRRRFKLNLYYYEQVGPDRFYFRLAPLGWLLIILPVVAILALFLFNRLWSDSSNGESNINVHIQPTTASPMNTPVIRQAPPPSPPPNIKQPKYSMPTPPITATPSRNTNEQLTPKPTPQPPPSESPP